MQPTNQFQQPQGKMFLKVVGILLIIFGGFALIGALGLLAGGGLVSSALGGYSGAALGGLIILSGVIALIAGGLNLVVGILGVANCAKPEKAQTCFIAGIVLVAVQVVSGIINIVSSNFNFFSFLIGLILPVLFIVGAMKNKAVSA